MSKALNILLALLLVVGAVLYFRDKQGNGEVTVRQSYLDSLVTVASMPPTVVYKDTVILKDTVIYRYKDKLIPVYVDSSGISTYADSLVNEEIDVKVTARTRGELLSLNWEYTPIIKQITKEITVTKPFPMPYEVKTIKSGILVGIGAGYGQQGVIVSVKAGLIDKQGWVYTGEVGQHGGQYFALGIGRVF